MVKSKNENELIKNIRETLGMSQKEFASYFGLSRFAINKIENNKQMPTKLMIGVCKIVGDLDQKNAISFLNKLKVD